jgi:hypothetical protein
MMIIKRKMGLKVKLWIHLHQCVIAILVNLINWKACLINNKIDREFFTMPSLITNDLTSIFTNFINVQQFQLHN